MSSALWTSWKEWLFAFSSEFTPYKAERPLQGITKKEKDEDENHIKISRSTCKKEAFNIGVIITSRNGNRKGMQPNKIASYTYQHNK